MPVKIKFKLCLSSFSLNTSYVYKAVQSISLMHFPQLEKLQIYIGFTVSSERIVEKISSIATRCPQLRSIVGSNSICELTKPENEVVRWKATRYDNEGVFSID